MDTAILEEVIFKFSQEGNSSGTTQTPGFDDFEELTITIESVGASIDKVGGFYVLRSPTGWSVNDISEIQDLFKIINKIMP